MGLVRMEVVCVCFDVLFFISEFHFLFLLIFILFGLLAEEARRFAHDTHILSTTGCLRFSLKMDFEVKTSS